MSVSAIVHRTIETHHLLAQGDAVLVALSGGPDSVALLHLLAGMRKSMQLRLHAVYINHQIRKRAALAEERFCAKLCDRLEIPLTVVREDIPSLARREKIGLEEAGRNFRYATFERITTEEELSKIALGHHQDDQVETILFRIMRGTSRTGLAGIPVKRGKIIRPLYDLTKAQILEYLALHDLTYCRDSSNQQTTFSRNYIRQRLLPEIRRRLNPRVDRALLNLAQIVDEEEAVLAKQVNRAIRKAVRISSGGKIELDRTVYCGYTHWLRRRLVRYCLGSVSGVSAVERETIDRLDQMILRGDPAISLPGKVQAVFAGTTLVFASGTPIHYERELVLGQAVLVAPLGLRARCTVKSRGTGQIKSRRRSNRVALDWEKVVAPIVIRSIRPGDRFQPLGMDGRKKVGDYLTDRKAPKVYRDEIPVVADRHGVIWLVGYEIADRVKVDASTRKVVTLEVTIAKRTLPPAV